jgi:hypothetical protein
VIFAKDTNMKCVTCGHEIYSKHNGFGSHEDLRTCITYIAESLGYLEPYVPPNKPERFASLRSCLLPISTNQGYDLGQLLQAFTEARKLIRDHNDMHAKMCMDLVDWLHRWE